MAKKEVNVTGGNKRRVQVRKAVRGSFAAAERQVFLDHLAACCNVTRAAAAAGVGVSTVYDARRRDPAFAGQWDEAIEAGYVTLEALLIERAALGGAHGGGGYVPGETPVPGPETIDTWLALDLLRLARAPKARPGKRNGAPPRRASEKALTDAICAQLDALDRRAKRGKAQTSRR